MIEASMNPSEGERTFAVEVVRKLRLAGFEALFAGGCVRDEILGLTPADYDVATSASPQQVLQLFPRSLAVGAAFGVVEVLGPRGPKGPMHIQVATFRTDGPYVDGRRPTTVHYGTAKEDALRRDFTINGMFLDPVSGECIDHVGGKQDLEARIVRAIGNPIDRFGEDKLRVLRAVRMAARFGFVIETDTWNAILANAKAIHLVSPERIAEELRKILTHPTRLEGIKLLQKAGLFREIFGESIPEPDQTTWQAVGHLPPEAGFELVASLFPTNPADWDNWAERLRLSRAEANLGGWLITHQDVLGRAHCLPNSVIFPLLAHPAHRELLRRETALVLAKGESLAGVGRCHELLSHPPTGGLNPPPLLTGNDLKALGLPQGPLFATILGKLRAAQLDHKIHTPEEARALALSVFRETTQEIPQPGA